MVENQINFKQLNRDFYNHCSAKITKEFKNIDGIKALYKFGNINAPGNSDIDFLIVIEPDKNISRKIFETLVHKFTPQEKFIVFQHNPLIIGEDLLKKIQYIRSCSNIINLFGEKYKIDEIQDNYSKLYMLIDLLIQYYPTAFLLQNIPKRDSFQVVNASKFIFKLYNELTSGLTINSHQKYNEKEIDDIIERNDYLRSNYFSELPKEISQEKIQYKKRLLKQIYYLNISINDFLEKQLETHKERKEKEIYRGKLFSKKYEMNYYEYSILDKHFILGEQPNNYLEVFKNNIKKTFLEAKKKRDEYIEMYFKFIDSYVFGRSLYYPWWYKRSAKIFLKNFLILNARFFYDKKNPFE